MYYYTEKLAMYRILYSQLRTDVLYSILYRSLRTYAWYSILYSHLRTVFRVKMKKQLSLTVQSRPSSVSSIILMLHGFTNKITLVLFIQLVTQTNRAFKKLIVILWLNHSVV